MCNYDMWNVREAYQCAFECRHHRVHHAHLPLEVLASERLGQTKLVVSNNPRAMVMYLLQIHRYSTFTDHNWLLA